MNTETDNTRNGDADNNFRNDIEKNAPDSDAEKKASRTLLITVGVVVIVVAAVALIGFLCLNRPDEVIEGQVEGTTVRISGKLAGRVLEFYVEEGDTVQAGDTLVHIHSSIVDAQLAQAEAMRSVAQAGERKADAGARVQVINAARDLVSQADAAVSITKKTYERMENLYKEGVVSEQKRDEAKAAYDAAVAAHSAANSQYQLALAGAQNEDKQAAAALVKASGATVSQVESLLEDSYLVAPCNGTVDQIFPEVGELVSLGAPIMNILKSERHVIFNVREEMLPDFEMGTELTVTLPGLNGREARVKVFYIRDMGSYATWRATKNVGSYDSRTFEVKARPVDDENASGMRPGMSALLVRP